MTTKPHLDVERRHDFVLLFDVSDGNPNGDPDAGNLPRVDPETMQGLVTDVSLKRKVRDWVDAARGDEGAFKIYVQSGGEALNTLHQRAYDDLGLKSTGAKQSRDDVDKAREWMCRNFYDIRMFGAVMTTGVNCGQVRGPVQMTFARSIDPIVPLDLSITRVAVTRPEDARVIVGEDGGEGKGGKQTEMGRKALVPYGLYRAYGFFNPHFAAQTGVTEEDLGLFWDALQNMWDLDRSSSRGLMACRAFYVFSHESRLGNAPAQRLFNRVTATRREAVDAPRSFGDYVVTVDSDGIPPGVVLTRLEN
ncbi:MAG: type I-C CRISPR-associated protein Cas7/Csd2 [Anaerolinea sp.]|jgi:CRISPR-associated protein Csd2|nr:type I-C CRISPR-associated protein Cas7/Csd2 [Anaerolinea sp.]